MDDIEISPATDEEAAALLERSKETYVEGLQGRRGLTAEEASAKADADTGRLVPDGGRTPGAVFLTARQDGRVLGGVWAAVQGPDREGEAWIYFLWVDPAERRRGLGRRLVERTAADVRSRGAAHLALNVFGDNTAAIALYEALGFRVGAQQMTLPLS
ncbi:MAG TPA: GNAT family N-acetyltransferase [Blastococcus sp.]|nr:GNAT family N-acetyltransferase [Blastococcus sp.]